MQTIIGVRFKKAGKIYYFAPGNLDIKLGDKVIVETARGMECGETVIGPREESEDKIVPPLKVVHRIANESDIRRIAENKEKEKEAFGICEEKIAAHGLPMNLVEVEYTFDMNKIIFYFTADGRIDFRELVKDLAAVFRTRIELRQIGVRDEAKFMGGIGCCGRPLCCATFLGDFEPVSIRMAKDQNLSLNPTKISGICGRLMCCLKYENDCYCGENCPHKQKKIMPPSQGSRVVSVEGEGKVISLNQQRRSATILLDSGRTIVAAWEDVIEKDEDDTSMAASMMAAYEEQESEAAEILAEDFGEGAENKHSDRGERRERRPRENRENRDNRREGGHRSHNSHNRSRDSRDAGHRRGNRDNRPKNNKRGDKRSRDNRERH
ncbi:MAG: stage 0 sporulation protein [Selenomonas ruminantium]|jgi:cell fate regulator YaaT (PSP1 superfamily)|uniref:Stage 0 sporulation protein n=1 Tax=Selenomonas ruminantium TaxID=971 RepID=A0A927ZQW4_SELRU|nr:stage 0 sporulation family protein [Selenomonas ruminantium]MBE6085589.1 stage 0 sporulation protein [Selenomonas ruminantium]